MTSKAVVHFNDGGHEYRYEVPYLEAGGPDVV